MCPILRTLFASGVVNTSRTSTVDKPTKWKRWRKQTYLTANSTSWSSLSAFTLFLSFFFWPCCTSLSFILIWFLNLNGFLRTIIVMESFRNALLVNFFFSSSLYAVNSTLFHSLMDFIWVWIWFLYVSFECKRDFVNEPLLPIQSMNRL